MPEEVLFQAGVIGFARLSGICELQRARQRPLFEPEARAFLIFKHVDQGVSD